MPDIVSISKAALNVAWNEKTRAAESPDSVGQISEYVQINAQDQNWSKTKFGFNVKSGQLAGWPYFSGLVRPDWILLKYRLLRMEQNLSNDTRVFDDSQVNQDKVL